MLSGAKPPVTQQGNKACFQNKKTPRVSKDNGANYVRTHIYFVHTGIILRKPPNIREPNVGLQLKLFEKCEAQLSGIPSLTGRRLHLLEFIPAEQRLHIDLTPVLEPKGNKNTCWRCNGHRNTAQPDTPTSCAPISVDTRM